MKSRALSTPVSLRRTAAELRAFALGLPGACEAYPWGERVIKVNRKVFVFLGRDAELDDHLGFSVKLPDSADAVLALDLAEPTGYGLGRAGWVTVRSTRDQSLPLELLQSWVLESYRAIAPKTLIKQLDSRLAAGPTHR